MKRHRHKTKNENWSNLNTWMNPTTLGKNTIDSKKKYSNMIISFSEYRKNGRGWTTLIFLFKDRKMIQECRISSRIFRLAEKSESKMIRNYVIFWELKSERNKIENPCRKNTRKIFQLQKKSFKVFIDTKIAKFSTLPNISIKLDTKA